MNIANIAKFDLQLLNPNPRILWELKGRTNIQSSRYQCLHLTSAIAFCIHPQTLVFHRCEIQMSNGKIQLASSFLSCSLNLVGVIDFSKHWQFVGYLHLSYVIDNKQWKQIWINLSCIHNRRPCLLCDSNLSSFPTYSTGCLVLNDQFPTLLRRHLHPITFLSSFSEVLSQGAATVVAQFTNPSRTACTQRLCKRDRFLTLCASNSVTMVTTLIFYFNVFAISMVIAHGTQSQV